MGADPEAHAVGRLTLEVRSTKGALLRYFNVAHEAVTWKLDGLSEHDVRRPLTPTGTNLLGLMKHLAWVELGYFGEVFDRPSGIPLAARDDDPHTDMYANADETRADIERLFADAWEHSKATIEALPLDAEGHVPWWGEAGNPVTLVQIVVHMTTEIYRHLGQMDILRESIDGAVGMREGAENMPPEEEASWADYSAKLERIATEASHRSSGVSPDEGS